MPRLPSMSWWLQCALIWDLRMMRLDAWVLPRMQMECRQAFSISRHVNIRTSVSTRLFMKAEGCFGLAVRWYNDILSMWCALQGVFLKKNVIQVAGRALNLNIRELAPQVLPWLELVRHFLFQYSFGKAETRHIPDSCPGIGASHLPCPFPQCFNQPQDTSCWTQSPMIIEDARWMQFKCSRDKSYKPDFGLAFNHFLLHTGGRGVLDALEESLQLKKAHMQPSRDVLRKFGNTSAASTWYILSRVESTTGVSKNDRLWQLGWAGFVVCLNCFSANSGTCVRSCG